LRQFCVDHRIVVIDKGRTMHPRDYRKLQGWTLEEMAALLGVANASVVSKHECGTSSPSLEVISRYGEVTGGEVTFDDFAVIRSARRAAVSRRGRGAKTERTAHV
jgi:transcriptional regulator with XRE-family HTH domain